jgi:hypothetical protein
LLLLRIPLEVLLVEAGIVMQDDGAVMEMEILHIVIERRQIRCLCSGHVTFDKFEGFVLLFPGLDFLITSVIATHMVVFFR